MIFFNYKDRPHTFTEEEIEFAKELAQTAAIAYYNAELFEQARVAQQEVQKARQKIQHVLDGVTDGVAEIGPDWNLTNVSETAARILGSMVENIKGASVWDVFPCSEDSKIAIAFREAIEKNSPVHFEEYFPDPINKWIHCHCYPFDDGLSIYFQDTTQKRKADNAANYLAALVESSSDAIISIGLDGLVNSWNHGAESLFGYLSEEMIGRPLELICPPDRLDEMNLALSQIRSGHKVVPFETQRMTKDGRLIDVAVTASPIRDSNGEIVGASKISHYIGERKEMERQIRCQSDLLEEQSKRKDEFLAMLSHELRNPLAPIQTAVQIMKLSHPDLPPIETIDRQVQNMTKLVDDLLEVSRALSGRLHLELVELSVNDIIKHALESSRPLIETRCHVVRTHLLEDDGWVLADRTRLEQVLVNLLNNAAKYTPNSGEIDIHAHQVNGQIQISVIDNGMGIDEELRPVIFDLFTQADRSLDRSEGGLGIGLSLVKRLVEMHEGTIEVFSPPSGRESGSEFRITMPAIEIPKADVEQSGEDNATPYHRLKILIVDDNHDLSAMLSMLLEMHNHETRTAADGYAGIDAAREWKPNVILLDIGLPGVSGLEVAQTLRAELGSETLMIALTGYGRESDIEQTRQAGFDGHLIKPFEYSQLEKFLIARF